MYSTNIHEAKTHLSQWLALAAKGEEVIICKAGKPIAKLVPYQSEKKERPSGLLKDKITIFDDFDNLPPGFEDYIK